MEKMRGIKFIRWIGVALTVAVAIGFFAPDFSYASRGSATDARVRAALSQMRSIAELIFNSSSDLSYAQLGCSYDSAYSQQMDNICKEIELRSGEEPVIYSSKEDYCAYGVLPVEKMYACIDSTGRGIPTFIFPGDTGYCDGNTYLCPTDVGLAPPLSPKERAFEILTYGSLIIFGVFVAVFLVFTWLRAIQRRKSELIAEKTREVLREEIKSYFFYYFFSLSGVVNIVLLFIIFGISQFTSSAQLELLFLLFYLFVLLFSLIAPAGILLFGLNAVRKSWQNSTKGVCWESYIAAFCLSAVWFMVNFFYVNTFDTGTKGMVFMVLVYGFGLGLSTSCLISKRKANKIIGIISLLVYIVLGLGLFVLLFGL